ncbi:MAG: FxsC protein [Pyrinomonadaceae bacterium]
MVWFFVSYAHIDDGDQYIKRFCDQLSASVTPRVRAAGGSVGFFDRKGIEVGDSWPQKLGQGLQDCRVFIPVYTANYFASEFCGKEFAVFRRRMQALAPEKIPPLILPVPWIPEAELPPRPEAIAELQYSQGERGELLKQVGLRQLMRQNRHKDAREDIIDYLAGRIAELGNKHLPPPLEPMPAIKEIQSAWKTEVSVAAQARPPTAPNTGPRWVQFIFVAGKRSELRALRQSVDFYGDEGGIDWHPYLPDMPDEVGLMAQTIAAEEKLRFEAVSLDQDIIKRLDAAEQENKIVAIVVDTWTLRLERYRTFMRQYDSRHFLNCVVLVPWNSKDPETTSGKVALEQAVADLFRRKIMMRDPNHFITGIDSPEEFKKQMKTALNAAKNHIINSTTATVFRKAASDQAVPFPTVQAVRT